MTVVSIEPAVYGPVPATRVVPATVGVEVRLLGGFDVRIDGVSHPLQPAGQRLVALVALAPRGVTRSFAAFQLWPDTDERRAMANLRSTLWRVNQVADDVVVSLHGRLRIAEHVWLDIRDGLEAQALDRADHQALLPFSGALSDLLPDWYEDWLLVERERYRQWSMNVLEQRADQALRHGRSNEALQLALAAIAIDPARERAHGIVVAAHRHDGNELDARREIARHRHCLLESADEGTFQLLEPIN